MADLLPNEIQAVQAYLDTHGLHHEEVKDDITDHICCQVEALLDQGHGFETAFEDIKSSFSPAAIAKIQADTTFYLTFKQNIIMIKGIFITAYISVCLYAMSIGFAGFFEFIFMGDPKTFLLLISVMQVAAVSTFCFGFLPLLFRYGYKRFMGQLAA